MERNRQTQSNRGYVRRDARLSSSVGASQPSQQSSFSSGVKAVNKIVSDDSKPKKTRRDCLRKSVK